MLDNASKYQPGCHRVGRLLHLVTGNKLFVRLIMDKERIERFLKRLAELETQFGNKALLDAVREGFMAIFGSEDTSGAPVVCEGIDQEEAASSHPLGCG